MDSSLEGPRSDDPLPVPARYMSPEEDSARWNDFPFREGDVVISTRSKSGTTWLQMICALLIFQTPDLQEPLSRMSPWFDSLTIPKTELEQRLEAQQHRRFIKTHTPLDGIPIDPRATYIVVAREPLDAAVSLYHQGNNLNRKRIRELTGQPEPAEPWKPRPPLREWLLGWIDKDVSPQEEMDSLRGVMWHLSDAWTRRDQPNIILLHYEDLLQDLEGQMWKLAGRLNIEVPESVWPVLVEAATFDSMRARAETVAPISSGILKDPGAFFRRGSSGSGREVLTDQEMAHYRERVAAMAPPDLMEWLQR